MFDSITLFDWSPSFGIGRRGRRLLERGAEANATIVGLKVTRTGTDSDSSNSNHYAYALDVDQPAGAPVRLGCRQFLAPQRGLVGLGSRVVVRWRGTDVIIDWATTLQRLSVETAVGDSTAFWKPVKTPPPPGVLDHEQSGRRKRIAGGRAAQATVVAIHEIGSVFGSLENVNVDVTLVFADDGSSGTGVLKRIVPPDYARSLLTVGRELPVGVDRGGERITVDWIAAANAAAGVGAAS